MSLGPIDIERYTNIIEAKSKQPCFAAFPTFVHLEGIFGLDQAW